MNLISAERPLVAAHRGTAGGNIPCNSLAAFKAALRQGADIIELDVSASRDKQLFCFHPTMEPAHLLFPFPLSMLSTKQIRTLHYHNYDFAKTNERILSLDVAFELLKGKCLINIDKFWMNPALIVNCIRRHKIEEQVIIKTPNEERYFQAVEALAPDIAFMPMVRETDNASRLLLKRKLNLVGIEVIFKTESAQVISEENIAFLHKNGLAVWGNAIVYNQKSVIAAGHTDDVAVTVNPDYGWGWFVEKGFDIIQTDWVLPLRQYLNQYTYERNWKTMKETLVDLKERRSCRKYSSKQVEKEKLDLILEAGTFAPTGRNAQSPVIVAVQDPETVRALSKLNASVMGADTDPFYGAPTVLVVFADSTVNTYRDDGALVMGNLLNAAHAVGVDSCYIYRAREAFKTEEGKRFLKKWGLDEKYEGIGNCILGYGEEGGIRPVSERKKGYIIWD